MSQHTSRGDKDASSGTHGAGQSNLQRVDRRLIAADVRPHKGLVGVLVLLIVGTIFSCKMIDALGSVGYNPYLKEDMGIYSNVVSTRTATATPFEHVQAVVTPSPVMPGALQAAATSAPPGAGPGSGPDLGPRLTIVPSATRYPTATAGQ